MIEELSRLGVSVIEDDAGSRIGSDCGNLLARLPGGGTGRGRRGLPGRSVLLCAHLDTVPLTAPVDPVLEEGSLGKRERGDPGRRQQGRRRGHPGGGPPSSPPRARRLDLELLFTVGEEISLAGAAAFDASVLRSEYGYVFDHASPIGEVIIGSPCHFRIEASFRGAAAHAGIRPEEGRSAILAASQAIASLRQGRLEGEGTVNVGTISGGHGDQRRPRTVRAAGRGAGRR